MSNRISKLMICNNIKLDKEYKNVVNYTEQQMVQLCETNMIASSNTCSFIRNNGRIFTPFTYAQCLQSNYIAFQNPDYSNKWFFGWIDSVHYEGEKNTSIEYTVDVWSTWYSSLSFEQCMVEREHINSVDDVPGANIIPEHVDTGDYVVNAHLRDKFNREAPSLNDIVYYIVVASTKDMNTTNNVAGAIYNGIPTGIRYFYYGINKNPVQR